MTLDKDAQSWLEQFVRDHQGMAGTVHLREGERLRLLAAVNIPPKVQEIVAIVPKGKGMAGLAFERNDAVVTCNIQTDATGQVRPGARAVGAKAGVAFPVSDESGQVRAVVGIAYEDEKTIKESEIEAMKRAAAALP